MSLSRFCEPTSMINLEPINHFDIKYIIISNILNVFRTYFLLFIIKKDVINCIIDILFYE